jgi:hypothetical protein
VKRLDFVYFEAGGGHRSAAIALKTLAEQQGRPWQVRLVNLQEVLDPLDIFRKYTGIRLQEVYNLLLRKGWTLGSAQLLMAMHGIIRLYHRGQVKLLGRLWSDATPDLVVSLVPNFNRAMFEALRATDPRVPYVTVLTDFADYPPHFWMEPQPQYVVCGTERAVQQALAMGYSPERVLRASGMILRPSFYEPIELAIGDERDRVGLLPDLPTGLVLFGGEGSGEMLRIAEQVDRTGVALQLIFVCGKNERLRNRLAGLNTRYPKYVVGFTSEIARLMNMSDFFIGKAGPGSISEALAMKLPVIVACNSWTLPQECYNADWVREKKVGIVLRSFGEIGRAVRELLQPATLATLRANAAAVENRAVFEIPDMLESILNQ